MNGKVVSIIHDSRILRTVKNARVFLPVVIVVHLSDACKSNTNEFSNLVGEATHYGGQTMLRIWLSMSMAGSKPFLGMGKLLAPSLLVVAAAVHLLRLSADGAGAVQLEPGHDALLVENVITIQLPNLF